MAGAVLVVTRALEVLLVDDELPAIRRLERLINDQPDAVVCGQATDPAQVARMCRELSPDVVLLDVEMPGLDGVGLARGLRELSPAPAIIFVTAFEQYAVDAFDVAAVDYLVKPVRPERLVKALSRARNRPRNRPATLQSRLGDRLLTIPVSDIRALIAEDKYTVVHYSGTTALVEDSLVSLEQRFPEVFFRVHRKALVSKRYLRGLHRDAEGQERVELDGMDACPPVSRRNLAQVRQLLRQQA